MKWISAELEEAGAANSENHLSWLGSDDLTDSPIMRLLGPGGVGDLRLRASAYGDPNFKTQRTREYKMLESTTPALKRGARRGRD